MPYRNKEDKRRRAREYHQECLEGTQTKARVKATQAKATSKRNAKRKALLDRLRSVPCADCKETFPPFCMDFDHLPGFIKVKPVMAMAHGRLDALMEEISKCEIVCAICHRYRTVERRTAIV